MIFMYEIINNILLQVKEYNGQRVVTFRDIDTVHHKPEGTARKRFNDNRKHFVEGEDFYKITPSEFRTAIGEMDKRQKNYITLFTESGYLMLVKSLTDDLAWDVQRQLVNSYFKVQQIQANEVLTNPIEQNGQRVLTTTQLAKSYGTDEKTIRKNFERKSDRYIEGKHYYRLTEEALKEFKIATRQIDVLPKNINTLYLWTEKGALLHAKSLNTDKAWEVYDFLIDTYFRVQELKTSYTDTLLKMYQEQNQSYNALLQEQNELENRIDLLENRITEQESQRTSLLAPAPKEKTFYFTNDDNEYHIKDFLNSDKVQICPYAEVQALLLYKLYQEWCRENNVYCCSIAMFGTRIKKIDGISHRKTKRCKKYIGIKVPIIY